MPARLARIVQQWDYGSALIASISAGKTVL